MNDWFTIDKIDAKTYVISEYHHPEETHCYLLNGNERSLLIDTGVGISNIYIEVLHTPGHSPGHCCFYEQDRGWLYSGDLIYQGCLDAFYPTTDPDAFMRSVEKVKALAPRKIFPAHHQLDIPVSLVCEIADAFQSLLWQGKLQQGNGVFDFGEFQIHI